MGNISCQCGFIFSDGDVPCEYEFNLIPDTEIELVVSKIISEVKIQDDLEILIPSILFNASKTAYVCPNCKRLLIFLNGIGQKARSYIPEIND